MPNESPAGLLRRLGAIFYDSLLVVAVLFALLFVIVPFTGELGPLATRLAIVPIVTLFFCFFWTRRGQTVGMLAWRLRITRSDGTAIGWADALKRIGMLWLLLLLPVGGEAALGHWLEPNVRSILTWGLYAPLAASYLWICVDRERRAWHDRVSQTRMWVVPKTRT